MYDSRDRQHRCVTRWLLSLGHLLLHSGSKLERGSTSLRSSTWGALRMARIGGFSFGGIPISRALGIKISGGFFIRHVDNFNSLKQKLERMFPYYLNMSEYRSCIASTTVISKKQTWWTRKRRDRSEEIRVRQLLAQTNWMRFIVEYATVA